MNVARIVAVIRREKLSKSTKMCIRDRDKGVSEQEAQQYADANIDQYAKRLPQGYSDWESALFNTGYQQDYNPVSYTHLDVYKRQSYICDVKFTA